MFDSPEQALRFAFKIRTRSIISRPHNVFLSKEKQKNYNREAMTAYDFHAQGALIIGYVEKMGNAETAWMYWVYGNAQEKEQAARVLAEGYEWMGVGVERMEIFRALMSSSVRRYAKDMAISKSKAWRIRRRVLDALSPLERRVLDDLWDWLGVGKLST